MTDPSKSGRNDGKKLEHIVSLIEGWLVPKGFEVQKRKPVFDDIGNQIAELDVFITGRIGSATITSLIECRDRPSEGAAPRSWIEQLMGRRTSLKLNNVMAASTTGFADGAKALAEQQGIELRNHYCPVKIQSPSCNVFP